MQMPAMPAAAPIAMSEDNGVATTQRATPIPLEDALAARTLVHSIVLNRVLQTQTELKAEPQPPASHEETFRQLESPDTLSTPLAGLPTSNGASSTKEVMQESFSWSEDLLEESAEEQHMAASEMSQHFSNFDTMGPGSGFESDAPTPMLAMPLAEPAAGSSPGWEELCGTPLVSHMWFGSLEAISSRLHSQMEADAALDSAPPQGFASYSDAYAPTAWEEASQAEAVNRVQRARPQALDPDSPSAAGSAPGTTPRQGGGNAKAAFSRAKQLLPMASALARQPSTPKAQLDTGLSQRDRERVSSSAAGAESAQAPPPSPKASKPKLDTGLPKKEKPVADAASVSPKEDASEGGESASNVEEDLSGAEPKVVTIKVKPHRAKAGRGKAPTAPVEVALASLPDMYVYEGGSSTPPEMMGLDEAYTQMNGDAANDPQMPTRHQRSAKLLHSLLGPKPPASGHSQRKPTRLRAPVQRELESASREELCGGLSTESWNYSTSTAFQFGGAHTSSVQSRPGTTGFLNLDWGQQKQSQKSAELAWKRRRENGWVMPSASDSRGEGNTSQGSPLLATPPRTAPAKVLGRGLYGPAEDGRKPGSAMLTAGGRYQEAAAALMDTFYAPQTLPSSEVHHHDASLLSFDGEDVYLPMQSSVDSYGTSMTGGLSPLPSQPSQARSQVFTAPGNSAARANLNSARGLRAYLRCRPGLLPGV